MQIPFQTAVVCCLRCSMGDEGCRSESAAKAPFDVESQTQRKATRLAIRGAGSPTQSIENMKGVGAKGILALCAVIQI